MSERAYLGDIVVRDGEPPGGNPFRAPESNERGLALERALAGSGSLRSDPTDI